MAVGGVLFRAAPMPRRLSLLLHILVVALLAWLMMGGSLLHPVGGAHHVANALNDAWTSSETYPPPVPASVPGIAPMMIPFGALSLLVVDLLACWLRRVSLAGLPLLAIYCVPISLLGRGVSWVVFLVAAVGFLLMMYLQESAHITRWGRPLGSTAASVDPSGLRRQHRRQQDDARARSAVSRSCSPSSSRCSSRPCTSTGSACSGRAAAAATASRWSTRSRT